MIDNTSICKIYIVKFIVFVLSFERIYIKYKKWKGFEVINELSYLRID